MLTAETFEREAKYYEPETLNRTANIVFLGNDFPLVDTEGSGVQNRISYVVALGGVEMERQLRDRILEPEFVSLYLAYKVRAAHRLLQQCKSEGRDIDEIQTDTYLVAATKEAMFQRHRSSEDDTLDVKSEVREFLGKEFKHGLDSFTPYSTMRQMIKLPVPQGGLGKVMKTADLKVAIQTEFPGIDMELRRRFEGSKNTLEGAAIHINKKDTWKKRLGVFK